MINLFNNCIIHRIWICNSNFWQHLHICVCPLRLLLFILIVSCITYEYIYVLDIVWDLVLLWTLNLCIRSSIILGALYLLWLDNFFHPILRLILHLILLIIRLLKILEICLGTLNLWLSSLGDCGYVPFITTYTHGLLVIKIYEFSRDGAYVWISGGFVLWLINLRRYIITTFLHV